MPDFEKEEFWKAIDELRRMDERAAERQQALAESLELLTHDVHELTINVRQDGENIRALARIAEIHDRRISHLEGDETT